MPAGIIYAVSRIIIITTLKEVCHNEETNSTPVAEFDFRRSKQS